MDILVIAAHADDEILGCGATIARLVEEGCGVNTLIMSVDPTSRQTLSQVSESSSVIGGIKPMVYNLPDQKMDTIPLLEVVRIVEEEIRATKPQIIFTHAIGDLNMDHAITARAVLTATRPHSNCSVPHVYSYEVLSSTEWAFAEIKPAFVPNYFYRVDRHHLDKKIEALERYTSEVRPAPHPRSPEVIIANAVKWGSVAGFDYAEAFKLVRSLQN